MASFHTCEHTGARSLRSSTNILMATWMQDYKRWRPCGLSTGWAHFIERKRKHEGIDNQMLVKQACSEGVCEVVGSLERRTFRDLPISLVVRTLPFKGGFPGGSASKESACNVGDLYSIPGSGRSLGEENGNPLQYPCLGSPIDRRAWRAAAMEL